MVFITLAGMHEGELMGISPTGKAVKTDGMILSRFQGGKIVEEWEILDMLAMFQHSVSCPFLRDNGRLAPSNQLCARRVTKLIIF